MTVTKPPAERTLPNKQQILDKILAGTMSGTSTSAANEPGQDRPVRPLAAVARTRRRPGRLVPVIAAAAVAAVVGAILVASRPAETEISLDLGPMTRAEIAKVFAICRPWKQPYTVLYATKIRSGWNQEDWAVAVEGHDPGGNGIRPGSGRLRACAGYPIKPVDETLTGSGMWMYDFHTTVGPAPTPEELAKLPKGQSFFVPTYDDGFRPQERISLQARPGKKWSTSLWLRVPSTVDRVRQRIVVNGRPQTPWFGSRTINGVSYTQAWMSAPVNPRDQFTIEVQFLDKSDKLVEIPGSNGLTSVIKGGGFGFDKRFKRSDYFVS
jgi:hypothetical protein